MIREILQWAFPVVVLMGISIGISRSEKLPLWQVILMLLAMTGIACGLANLVTWIY